MSQGENFQHFTLAYSNFRNQEERIYNKEDRGASSRVKFSCVFWAFLNSLLCSPDLFVCSCVSFHSFNSKWQTTQLKFISAMKEKPSVTPIMSATLSPMGASSLISCNDDRAGVPWAGKEWILLGTESTDVHHNYNSSANTEGVYLLYLWIHF